MKTIGDDSAASLPGQLRVSSAKAVRYFGMTTAERLLYRMTSGLPWRVRTVPIIGTYVFRWHRIREHFIGGCINPSIVVDAERNLVATLTDLSNTGIGSYPVVKITRERLDLIDGPRPENGSCYASVALYRASEMSDVRGRWDDFIPIVANCLVADEQACQNTCDRIPSSGWQGLEIGLAQVPNPPERGLYHVDVPAEILDAAW